MQNEKKPLVIFILNVIAIIFSYYVTLFLHEWAHGTLAWLHGIKASPFDIQYGGWFLLNADEQVNYTALINAGHGVVAAQIGIAGVSADLLIIIGCFILLTYKNIQRKTNQFIFFYWLLTFNMIPLIQYFSVSTFSWQGDVGRFANGLGISAWWIFLPGSIFNIYAIWRILKIEVPKSYAVIPIKSISGQILFLLTTLVIIFLFIYARGFNPFSDKGMNPLGRIIAILSIIFVPILFILSYPSREWVRKAIVKFK